MNTSNKRERLIESASVLFHQKGIAATSLADIAKDADVPIGNVYYYFKAKEELALAALGRHQMDYIQQFELLNKELDDPRQRLKKLLEHYEAKSEEFAQHGCPIGKMVMDTDTSSGTIAEAAGNVFECVLGWITEQFNELGHNDHAKAYATSLLASIQGAALLAKATKNPDLMLIELARMLHFIDTLPNRRIHPGKIGLKVSTA